MGLLDFEPLDGRITKGPRSTFTETHMATFEQEQQTGELSSSATFENDVWKPLDDFLGDGGPLQGENSLSEEMVDRLFEQDFRPDDALLGDMIKEMDSLGISYPETILPEALGQRRESATSTYVNQATQRGRVIERGGFLGQLTGGFSSGFDNFESVVTLPIGAAARTGMLMTALIEGGVNAFTEAATTPQRNKFLTELGLPEESLLQNALFGFAVGGTLGGAIKGAQRLPGAIRDRRTRQEAAKIGAQSNNPATRATALAVTRDLQMEADALASPKGPELREHVARATEAVDAAKEGRPPNIPDRPLAVAPRVAEDGSTLLDPRELLVQPEVFQFKSDTVAAGGVTRKLQDVNEWVPHRAGVAIVYEYADGRQAIADGHQRTALANRIMEQDPSQDIKLRAEVFREADGFTVEDIRVLAAMKNIAEAADGMTARMSGDAAKVLRLRPDLVDQLPAGPGIARARNLSRLSDDAFDLYINRVIDERFAEQIGRMVDSPSMHLPIARLIERVKPETTAQAESVISQALEAPTSTTKTADLFGESEVVESLYLEQAKVLERSMQIMRNDRSVFQTLTDQAEKIEGAGANRLDKKTNADARKEVETALAAIKTLAHRAGPISEALRDGAKNYKETGRLKDAAQKVAQAVRGEVQRNGLSGLTDGGARRGGQPARASEGTPDTNASFSDPLGDAAKVQVQQTRLAEPDTVPGGKEELAALVAAGASREEIDNHPIFKAALEKMESIPETDRAPGFGTPEFEDARAFVFGGEEVIGLKEAMGRWINGAKRLAFDETGTIYEGVGRDKTATIVLGPPAAGKSSIANDIALAQRAAIIDADEIKKTIPEFEGGIGASAVHEESSVYTQGLEAALRQEGANVVFPKVGAGQASIERTIKAFKDAGYTVSLVNMDVTPENAYRRMVQRFLNTDRIINPEYVDAVGSKPTETFANIKQKGGADGYAQIDNNGARFDPATVSEIEGVNPLKGSRFQDAPIGQQGPDGRRGADAEKAPRSEVTPAGEQRLIDGVAPITQRDRLQADLDRPLSAPGRASDTQIGGLFDPNDPSRFDLFEQVPVGRGFDDEGNEIALTKSRADIAAELDADDEFVEQLEVCLK